MILKLIAVLFFLFMLWIIVEADYGANAVFFDLIGDIPFADKAGHFSLFAVFTFLSTLATGFKRVEFRWGSISLAILLVSGFALVEECTQLFIKTRSFDLLDLISDMAGILLAGFVANCLFRRLTESSG